jgi:hypothetical protein
MPCSRSSSSLPKSACPTTTTCSSGFRTRRSSARWSGSRMTPHCTSRGRCSIRSSGAVVGRPGGLGSRWPAAHGRCRRHAADALASAAAAEAESGRSAGRSWRVGSCVVLCRSDQPNLLRHVPEASRYAYVKKALAGARAIGLIEMRDLVNYVCMTLIYEERWYSDPRITVRMTRVKRGDLEFDEAIKLLPPSKPTES